MGITTVTSSIPARRAHTAPMAVTLLPPDITPRCPITTLRPRLLFLRMPRHLRLFTVTRAHPVMWAVTVTRVLTVTRALTDMRTVTLTQALTDMRSRGAWIREISPVLLLRQAVLHTDS